MIRLLEEDLLAALAAVDFPRFAAALGEYNRLAGRWFAPVQGGVFSTPTIAEAVGLLQEIAGVAGQSSWGPTVFAVSPVAQVANQVEVASALARLGYRLLATSARNVGYQLELQPEENKAWVPAKTLTVNQALR
jgi:predicted sugar kinase